MSKDWIIKISDNCGKLFDFNISCKSFECAEECADFISKDKDCIYIETLLTAVFIRLCCLNSKICLGGSFVRPYNKKQKRFATSFDF